VPSMASESSTTCVNGVTDCLFIEFREKNSDSGMDDASSSHAGDMVLVVNTINRRTQSIASAEVDMFLRKHKLFRLVEQEHVEEKKRKPRKPAKKATKVIKEEKPVESRYVTNPLAFDSILK
jgi:hypothetical protein